MKTTLYLLGLSFCILCVSHNSAQAAWWEFLFPSLKKEQYNPYDNLQAPFSAAEQSGKAIEKNADLSKSHRTDAEIAKWILQSLSDVMSLSGGNYENAIATKKAFFSDAGIIKFKSFLEKQKIATVLQSGQYDLHSVVEGIPILLNTGAVGGKYQWLYEADMMVTYLKRGAKDYKRMKPINQYYTIRVQAGRHADKTTQNSHDILIEDISGKEVKK